MTAPPSGTTLSEDNLRGIILYEYRLGSSEEGATTRINQLMGVGLVSHSTVRRWLEQFHAGNYSLEDEPQDVKPPIVIRELHLNKIDEFLLKRIVKKFTAISGGKFYRSCRGAKEFVDRIKPSWHLPDVELMYSYTQKTAWRMVPATDEYGLLRKRETRTIDAKIPLELCRIEVVTVNRCDPVYLKNSVLPELKAMSVGRLKLDVKMSEEEVQLLLTTSMPGAVEFDDYVYNGKFDLFKDFKNLHIGVHVCGYKSTWTAERLFQQLRERKTVTFRCNNFYTGMIIIFLKNWLMGESTGTLEELTFYQHEAYLRSHDMERVLNQTDIRNLTKSCLKTRDGYVLQGTGLGRLRIALDYNTDEIHFQFE